MLIHQPTPFLTAAFMVLALASTAPAAQPTTKKKSGSSETKKPATPAKTPVPKKKASTTPDKEKDSPKAAPQKEPTPEAKPDATPPEPPAKVRAPSASIEPGDLVEFPTLPARKQRLIESSLALTKLNLTYSYGSADPARGGMDCSGTLYYTLRAQGFKDVPRDSPGQYVWVRKAGGFQAVNSRSADSFEFDDLKPGDLLFWSGTYAVEREIPITHVMLYLGREKKTGNRVMFGASDGRSYKGVQRWGVSVFDFKMPRAADPSRANNPVFLGYGPIPGIGSGEPPVAASTPPVVEKAAERAEPEPKPGKEAAKDAKPTAKTPAKKPATRKK